MNRFDTPRNADDSNEAIRNDAAKASRGDRARMLRAMHALESALTDGAPTREMLWRKKVIAAGKELIAAMQHQNKEFDAEAGLLQQVVQDAPRLGNRVDELRKIHQKALQKLTNLLTRVELTELPALLDVAEVRTQLGEVLATIRSLQAMESDLIYEAYQVDLGGGD